MDLSKRFDLIHINVPRLVFSLVSVTFHTASNALYTFSYIMNKVIKPNTVLGRFKILTRIMATHK